VGLEYVRAFALTGFPWASLGYSQYRLLHLIQVADLTGVYGIGFLIVFANVVLYRLLRSRFGSHPCRQPVAGMAVLALLVGGTLLYGSSRLGSAPGGAPVKIALIQGNISQDVKWDPAFQEATVSIYERLTRRAMAGRPDLVVWPESATPFYFQDEYAYAQRLIGLVKGTGSYLLFGSPAYEQAGDRIHYLNSAFLVGPDGIVLGRSDKMHLVPFGEYVPLAHLLPFVHKLVAGIGDFSPAARLVPLETDKGKLGVLVCYEGIFPELSRAYVTAGSQILVNISNDAWYKRSSAPYQHLSMTVFRAVENRVPLVRATNTGISAIIDSRGRMHGTTPLFEETVLSGEVIPGSERTFYTRHGDLFAGLCLALTVILAVAGIVKRIE
jgi:apolipoprotein N-acyltransferase